MSSAIRIIVFSMMKYIIKSKITYYVFFLILLGLGVNKALAQEIKDYQFQGVYDVQTIMLKYCEDCWLELPPDYLTSKIVLSVNTNSEKDVFKALQSSSRAIGWELTRDGKKLVSTPIQNAENLVYISCMDLQPKNVPKYLYTASINADKMRCAQRDSLADREARRDSLTARRNDSLKNIPPLDFLQYELRYYSFSKSFSDKLGFEWNGIISEGNLHNKLSIYDNWKLYATETNDTTFNYRSMFFSLDSMLNVDWGSEEQTLQKTYQNDGVVTQEYEWRKYGLIVTIKRGGGRIKMEYTFRDKDNSVSVLQGSVVGKEKDTLFLQGNYNVNRVMVSGVPLLSKIPYVGILFSTENVINDLREFELYLIPHNRQTLDTLSMRSIERVEPIYKKGGKNERDSTASKTSDSGD